MPHRAVVAVILALILGCAGFAFSQDSAGLEQYLAAVKQSDPARQVSGLEQYLGTNPSGSLRNDALAIAAWDYARIFDRTRAADKARQLLTADNKNPVALAVLFDTGSAPSSEPTARLKELQSAMAVPWRKPEGLREIDFSILKQYVWRSLTGSAGLAYIDVKDYATAANFLQQVVESAPDDPRYVFGLGNALDHLKGREAEAFWYLARAVNLSSYSPQGQQIAAYARDRYHHAGGSDQDWNAFLTAASSPRQTMAPVVEARRSGPPVSGATAAAQAAEAKNNKKSKKEKKKEETLEASVHPDRGPRINNVPLPSEPLKPRLPTTTPVSLGILVQTSRLDPEYRKSIVFALSDLVRHLRQGDEAFILAFSDQLDFVQDLTDNAKLLEEAMDQMKPAKGAALFDAVAFAAGHLKRIAKNQNRVLLVISDGSTSQGQASSFDVSANLNQVRINCIGVDVNEESQRGLLRNLALYSGGQTAFINGASEFRSTTQQLAQQMGIAFPQ
jgi:tetratricopeptide (TPR) repeat protein